MTKTHSNLLNKQQQQTNKTLVKQKHVLYVLLYCEDDQTPRHMTQRSFEVSIPGDIQNSVRYNPEQLALTDPAWRRKIGPGISPEVSSNLSHPV